MEDIFNTDPLKLTRQDRNNVVAYLRAARETFLKEEATGKAKKTTGKAPKVALNEQLTIDDLDLGEV